MITLQTPNNNIKHFINTNSSILYIYNIEENKITQTMAEDFKAITFDVIEHKKNDNIRRTMDVHEAINGKNDFIKVVKVIASTTKEEGNFSEVDESTQITTNYLNVYLNAITFNNAAANNNYSISCEENLIELLKDETPAIYKLLKNLFHSENDEVLINFLNYLNVIGFTDKRQDVMFLFKGTTKDKEGQGAGKGVLKELLSLIFSGLVCAVSNESYKKDFNMELLNKKIVIFDELDFKSLKYAKLKDITGSETIRVESKGQNALIVPNVGSWLLFTNENDLREKIGANDRRTFIVHPNPINDSLKRDVIEPHYDGNFEHFKACMLSEIENFIHIICLATGKVKTPLELRTEAHKSYFSDSRYSLTDISNFDDIFTRGKSKRKFIEFLEELESHRDISKTQLEKMKYYLNTQFFPQEILEEVFSICQKYQIGGISSRVKSRVVIKALKDNLDNHGFEKFNLDTSFTYQKEKRRVKYNNCIRIKETSKEAQKEINKQIKSFYIQNIAA